MSATVTVYCDQESQYGTCTAQMITRLPTPPGLRAYQHRAAAAGLALLTHRIPAP